MKRVFKKIIKNTLIVVVGLVWLLWQPVLWLVMAGPKAILYYFFDVGISMAVIGSIIAYGDWRDKRMNPSYNPKHPCASCGKPVSISKMHCNDECRNKHEIMQFLDACQVESDVAKKIIRASSPTDQNYEAAFNPNV